MARVLIAMVVVGLAAAYAPRALRTCSLSRRAAATATEQSAPIATVSTLWRYPIKGFPPDGLSRVTVAENGTFPNDRQWAVADVSCDEFDAAAPKWVHKRHFHGAFRSGPALALLNTSFTNGRLRFFGPESGVADLGTPSGRALVEDVIGSRVGAKVKLCTGGEAHQFGNTQSGVRHHNDTRTIHLVNAASVRAVAAATGLPVAAAVFRPNVVLEGIAAWEEESWIGKTLRVGGSQLEIISRTVRCDAINNNPLTGERWPDGRDLVTEIAERFPAIGPYLGVYARVVSGGALALGDAAAFA